MDNLDPVPVLLLGTAQMASVAATLAYTPKSSPFRYVTLALVGGLGYNWYWSCAKLSTSGLWNGTSAATVVIYCLHHVDLLLIKKVEHADLVNAQNGSSAFLSALNQSFSTRGVGAKWQISNLTSFPSYYSNTSDPGRLSYLVRTAIIFAWQYLSLDLADVSMSQLSPQEQEEQYGNGQEFVFLNSTKEQLGTRVMTSVAGAFLLGRLIMDCVYRGMSLVAVGTGLSKPKDWPPWFGTMSDTYSIRLFWGKFWHQWLRGPLAAVSLFTTRRILHLPRRSTLEWYTNVLMTFTLSAAVHVLNEIVAGKGIQIGTLMIFQGFAVAMLIEDGVQAISRQFSGKEGSAKAKAKTPAWQKFVGYIWVLVVLCIVVPWFLYPSGRMPAGTMWTVPYSVVGDVGVPGTGIALAVLSVLIVGFLKPEV